MAVERTVGTFAKTTGAGGSTNVESGFGFAPKAIIFFLAGATADDTFVTGVRQSIGVVGQTGEGCISGFSADASNPTNVSRRVSNTKCLAILDATETLLAEADCVLDADGFTLTWTTNNAVAYRIGYLALGGDSITDTFVGSYQITATGAVPVTAPGFQPNAVLHLNAGAQNSFNTSAAGYGLSLGATDGTTQWAVYNGASDASATNTNAIRIHATDAVVLGSASTLGGSANTKVSHTSFDATGFTVTVDVFNSSRQVVYLAIKGGDHTVGSETKDTATPTGSDAIAGLASAPAAVLLASDQSVADGTVVESARFGIGVATGTAEAAAAWQDMRQTVPSSSDARSSSSKAVIKVNNDTQTVDAVADVTMGAAGFTLDWTTNDAVATVVRWWAVGPAPAAGGPATYYVRTTGSDAASGLSPALAWATIGKALGATGIASGDTLIIGGGTYRETVTVAMTTATAETVVRGDRDNVCGDGTEVRLSAFTTNDTTVPAAASALNLNGRDFLTFEDLTVVGGDTGNSCVTAVTATSTNVVFRRVAFLTGRAAAGGANVAVTAGADAPLSWLFDGCWFLWSNAAGAIVATLTRPVAADVDYDLQVRNCVGIGAAGAFVRVDATGANAFNGGGVDLAHNTVVCGGALLATASANLSTTIPCTAYKNVHVGGGTASFSATTSGQIIENDNRVLNATANANTTNGGASVYGPDHALLIDLGQSAVRGMAPRPFGTPLAGSPLLGRGGASGADPAADLLARPRPAGGATAKAWGALERHQTGRRGISLGADAGDYLELVGPADHDFAVPVDAVATTISVKVRWDATHADTNKPQARILYGGEIGWPDETVTATGTAGSAYETLTFTARTPTAKGIVTLRLISRSAAANGIAAFDTAVIAT